MANMQYVCFKDAYEAVFSRVNLKQCTAKIPGRCCPLLDICTSYTRYGKNASARFHYLKTTNSTIFIYILGSIAFKKNYN